MPFRPPGCTLFLRVTWHYQGSQHPLRSSSLLHLPNEHGDRPDSSTNRDLAGRQSGSIQFENMRKHDSSDIHFRHQAATTSFRSIQFYKFKRQCIESSTNPFLHHDISILIHIHIIHIISNQYLQCIRYVYIYMCVCLYIYILYIYIIIYI